MKRIEPVERTVITKRECVLLRCDMCGAEAEYPRDETFEYCDVGTAKGELSASWYIDGDCDVERIDLCLDCANWLIRQVRVGNVKRPPEAPDVLS